MLEYRGKTTTNLSLSQYLWSSLYFRFCCHIRWIGAVKCCFTGSAAVVRRPWSKLGLSALLKGTSTDFYDHVVNKLNALINRTRIPSSHSLSTSDAASRPRKPCNCNKSQCLKLYVLQLTGSSYPLNCSCVTEFPLLKKKRKILYLECRRHGDGHNLNVVLLSLQVL